MRNFPYTMCLCCMYINARHTLDIWYTIKLTRAQGICNQCTYWTLLGPLKNFNIIKFSHKSTPSEAFDEIHQVVLDLICENMALLVEPGKQGAIDTTDTATNGFYVIMFASEGYTLQDNTTIGGKIINAGELVVK